MNFQITNGLMPTTSQFPNPLVPSATSSGSNLLPLSVTVHWVHVHPHRPRTLSTSRRRLPAALEGAGWARRLGHIV